MAQKCEQRQSIEVVVWVVSKFWCCHLYACILNQKVINHCFDSEMKLEFRRRSISQYARN